MPKNHEEDSITVDNGDGDVTLEGQSLAHEEERNVFDASQQEASVNQVYKNMAMFNCVCIDIFMCMYVRY